MSPLSHTVRSITTRWPDLRSASTEEPVFVLAAGWRSGSTLLQRMLVRHCMVWGEPYGRAMVIDSLARPWQAFTDQWPSGAMFDAAPRVATDALRRSWIANLYPPPHALLAANVAALTSLLAEPARALGFERWGLKEVRLSIEHAAYLKWLFPRAKFLFLIRDPHACYRSFLRLKVTYVRWPDQPVDSPESYGRHWVDLAQGFVDRAQEVGGVVVRYEALCAPDFDAEAIDRYLGFALDLGAREFGVSSSGNPPAPADERERLQAVVGPLAERLGYPS